MDTRQVALTTLYAGVAFAASGLVVGLLVNGLALLAFSGEVHLTGIAAVLRTAVGGVVLYFLAHWLQARVARELAAAEEEEPVGPVVLGGVLGYLLDPFAWSGKALIGQAFLHAGAVTWVLDLVLWTTVVTVATLRPVGARF